MCIFDPWKSNAAETQKQQSIMQRTRKKQPGELFQPLTHEAVPGRTHIDVQTGKHTSVDRLVPSTPMVHRIHYAANANVSVFRDVPGGIGRCHQHFRQRQWNWSFVWPTNNPTLHTCQDWERCRNTDRGGRGRWPKQQLRPCQNNL